MDKLIIFPFNGNGLEALDCIQGQYELIGFADDLKEKQGIENQYFKVYSRELIDKYPEAFVLAVPGSPTSYSERERIIKSLKIRSDRFARVIHPGASVSKLSSIGFNVLLMAGVVITSNAAIGNHVCVLPNTVIHHDSSIGNYSLIGSNVTIAGNTKIGDSCYIGSGTSIINNVNIGAQTLIGMGSNVIRSLDVKSKAVGNPARLIE
ncbi:MAG: acetyltransferase [Candidatus Pedobacter colombiensis]|uniref:Acetyltransferase n=1 Tax=Candidatus Pedobacter colombiensis TaxID=3121371 RepID=A0AAJ5W8R4_9SPHI|nr:acetyltransferase [Pedobacter sp.]WEK19670.1 MAG: acetyltransferase [Pedobacter sp.]